MYVKKSRWSISYSKQRLPVPSFIASTNITQEMGGRDPFMSICKDERVMGLFGCYGGVWERFEYGRSSLCRDSRGKIFFSALLDKNSRQKYNISVIFGIFQVKKDKQRNLPCYVDNPRKLKGFCWEQVRFIGRLRCGLIYSNGRGNYISMILN